MSTTSLIHMFANIYRAIKSKEDSDILQQDLDNVTDWAGVEHG